MQLYTVYIHFWLYYICLSYPVKNMEFECAQLCECIPLTVHIWMNSDYPIIAHKSSKNFKVFSMTNQQLLVVINSVTILCETLPLLYEHYMFNLNGLFKCWSTVYMKLFSDSIYLLLFVNCTILANSVFKIGHWMGSPNENSYFVKHGPMMDRAFAARSISGSCLSKKQNFLMVEFILTPV